MDQAKVSKYLDSIVNDTFWVQLKKQVLTTCISTVNLQLNVLKKVFASHADNEQLQECNVGVLSVIECYKMQMFSFCPESFWKNSRKCNDAKSVINKCMLDVENFIVTYFG